MVHTGTDTRLNKPPRPVMQVTNPPAPAGSVGLYHLASEVGSIDELAEAVPQLLELDALVGMSDHGVSKSLYAKDPDGIEFEIMWRVPRESWGEAEHTATTQPLNLDAELKRWGTKTAHAAP